MRDPKKVDPARAHVLDAPERERGYLPAGLVPENAGLPFHLAVKARSVTDTGRRGVLSAAARTRRCDGGRRSRAGHLPGTQHRRYRELHEVAEGMTLPYPVAVICSSGQRSAVAASLLRLGATQVVHTANGGVGRGTARLADRSAVAATSSRSVANRFLEADPPGPMGGIGSAPNPPAYRFLRARLLRHGLRAGGGSSRASSGADSAPSVAPTCLLDRTLIVSLVEA